MFGFFKKKDDKNRKSVETVEEITLSEEAKAELLKKIADGKLLSIMIVRNQMKI